MRKISGILFVIMLVSIMLPAFYATAAPAGIPAIRGDVNGDGVVSTADAVLVANMCADKGTLTAAGKTAANITGGDIDMEDARRIARAGRGIVGYESLYSSASAANSALIAYFNAVANQVKTTGFISKNKTVYLTHDVSSSNTSNIKIGYIDIFGKEQPFPESLIKEFMDTTGTVNEEAYTAPRTVPISNTSYPILSDALCSKLSASDIKSISVKAAQKTDLLSSVPSKYKVGSREYDISSYKTKAASLASCLKITVVLKQETKATVASLGSSLSPREKVYDSGFRDMMKSFPMKESDSSFDMTMNCNNATSDLTVVYYVNSSTLQPTAARYTTKIVLNQSATLKGSGDVAGMEGFLSNITGSMDLKMDNLNDVFYLFTGTFA